MPSFLMTSRCTSVPINFLDLPSPSTAVLPKQNLPHQTCKSRPNKLMCETSYNSTSAVHSTASANVPVLAEDNKAWDESRQLISAINFSSSEADVILGKAFGWANSPYWGEERPKEVPNNESVQEILDYLRSLGLSDDDLHKLLKKFPEALGCSLDDEMKTNVAALEREWGIKGKSLRSLLLRNPKVLGYNVDCKGDCIAKCTRCWVRF